MLAALLCNLPEEGKSGGVPGRVDSGAREKRIVEGLRKDAFEYQRALELQGRKASIKVVPEPAFKEPETAKALPDDELAVLLAIMELS